MSDPPIDGVSRQRACIGLINVIPESGSHLEAAYRLTRSCGTSIERRRNAPSVATRNGPLVANGAVASVNAHRGVVEAGCVIAPALWAALGEVVAAALAKGQSDVASSSS
jgi:hypothetical protein